MSEPEPPHQPTEIAGYRIDRVLGRGGMSVVYLGWHPKLDQWAAIKVLSPELAGNPALRARFQREGETTARLGHPSVVATYGRGETADGQMWIVMQYVKGTTAEAASLAGAMTRVRALRVISEVAEVLDFAHSFGIVHQDVKPSNILLGERADGRERIVLADFGSAVVLSAASKSEPEEALVASFAYTAPEVITGDTVDRRADVYSLGCTLFRLLTGSVPFPGHSTAAAMANAHLVQPPPKPSELLPSASPALDEVIATALAKRPEDRYLTAGELAAAAAHALSPSPRPSSAASPPPPRVSVTPVESRNPHRPEARRAMIGAGVVTAVLLAAVLSWLAFTDHDDTAPISAPSSTTSAPAPHPRNIVLPRGYPPGACTRQDDAADPGTDVVMTCGPNLDPGGPVSGTYSLARDAPSLQAALSRVIASATTVICPGNIQSPGPWRRLADPAVPKGTLFCGIGSDGRPLIAWTFDPDRFLAVVQTSPGPDGLNTLYAWWASHS